MRRTWVALLGSVVVMGGCATLPTGPSVMVLPAPGKPFERFQTEDATCRQWASQQVGGAPGAPANQQTAAGAALGTALGAGLGAAIGAAAGHVGTGAAIGAGTGLLFGTAAGANADQVTGWEAQRRYDTAYQQCMYAQGNQVPGTVRARRRAAAVPPPPPPPPGYMPAPPSATGAPPAPTLPTPSMAPPPPPPPPAP